MTNACQEIARVSMIWGGWQTLNNKKTGHSRNVSGVDGETVNSFARDADQKIRRVAREIRNNAYQPTDLWPIITKKITGKYRIIAIPTIKDRIVQNVLLSYLNENDRCGVVNNVSYGFIKGRERGVKKAAKKAVHYRNECPWVYKADISTFFDSLDRVELKRKIRESVRSKSLHPTLFDIVDTEITDDVEPEKRKTITKAGIQKGKGIRQGMPLSPLLTNIYLKEFDKQIEAANLHMVRYADDFVIACQSKHQCEKAHELCANLLQEIGLELHALGQEDKTRIYNPSEAVDFLGVGLVPSEGGYSIRITKEQMRAIKTDLFRYGNVDQAVRDRLTLSTMGRKLNGKVEGYKAAYRDLCDNLGDLENHLGVWKRQVWENVYNDLGIKISELSRNERKFLELET